MRLTVKQKQILTVMRPTALNPRPGAPNPWGKQAWSRSEPTAPLQDWLPLSFHLIFLILWRHHIQWGTPLCISSPFCCQTPLLQKSPLIPFFSDQESIFRIIDPGIMFAKVSDKFHRKQNSSNTKTGQPNTPAGNQQVANVYSVKSIAPQQSILQQPGPGHGGIDGLTGGSPMDGIEG